jgi:hypothetical protein
MPMLKRGILRQKGGTYCRCHLQESLTEFTRQAVRFIQHSMAELFDSSAAAIAPLLGVSQNEVVFVPR